MEMTVKLAEFTQTIQKAISIFSTSDLGTDALKDEAAVVNITVQDARMCAHVGAKGFDVKTFCDVSGEDGKFAVRSGVLEKIKVAADEAILTVEDKVLTIRAGRFKAGFPLVPSKHYPTYDVPLTHTLDCSALAQALRVTDFTALQFGRPHVRVRAKKDGLRLWTHTDFTAAWVAVDSEPYEDLDTVVRAQTLLGATMGDVTALEFGADQRAWRARTENVDVVHPLYRVDIENIDEMFASMDTASSVTVQVAPAKLLEAIAAVGVTSGASSNEKRTAALMLNVLGPKRRLTVSGKSESGWASYRVSCTDVQNCPADLNKSVNVKVITTLMRNLQRDGDVTMTFLHDRVVVRTDNIAYMMSYVTDEEI